MLRYLVDSKTDLRDHCQVPAASALLEADALCLLLYLMLLQLRINCKYYCLSNDRSNPDCGRLTFQLSGADNASFRDVGCGNWRLFWREHVDRQHPIRGRYDVAIVVRSMNVQAGEKFVLYYER